MCGMTPTQFWEEEPRLFYSYLRKHEIEQDEDNFRSWRFCVYVYEAISVSLSSLFAEKGKKPPTYFEEPIKEFYCDYVPLTQKKKEETIINTHQSQVNYWAKLGKKERK